MQENKSMYVYIKVKKDTGHVWNMALRPCKTSRGSVAPPSYKKHQKLNTLPYSVWRVKHRKPNIQPYCRMVSNKSNTNLKYRAGTPYGGKKYKIIKFVGCFKIL